MLEFFFVFGKMRTMHEKEAVNGMIYGIGLDVTELDRITSAYERRSGFAERVLTEAELKLFLALRVTPNGISGWTLCRKRGLLEGLRNRYRQIVFPRYRNFARRVPEA